MPVPSPYVPPHLWGLSSDGHAAARRLMSRLPARATLLSSTERKAWETLGGSGNAVVRDARFNEVSRAGEPWGDGFHRLRRLYVEGAAHPGWEPAVDAADRFQAGIEAALRDSRCEDVVVATHGMVMTTWLVRRGGIAVGEAAEFWSALAFPDCLLVDADGQLWCRYP